MKINRNNYELFFVDYLDGKLSYSDKLELLAFLAINPDLEEELNLVRNIKIEPEKITFSAKNSLKKKEIVPEISFERFNELCVGKIENILNTEEEALLAKHLQLHPELEKDLRLFRMTVSQPDYSIEFSNKESLKHLEISAEKIDELLVGKIENDLNEKQEALLAKQLKQNPELEKDLQIFKKTILQPDMSVVFHEKASLKHYSFGVSYKKIVFRSLSAAAAIALLFVLYTYFFKQERFGNSPKMFATSLHSLNIKINHVQTAVVNTKKKTLASKNQQNTVQNNYQMALPKDTSNAIAQNNTKSLPDSINRYIAINNNIAVDTNINKKAKANNNKPSYNNFDKSYEAIFAESKYSHFRDMIENVPFQAIQSGPSVIKNKIGVWDIVEAGSKGISAITGADVNFNQKTDEKRQVKKYSFNIGRFGFSKTVHK